MNRFLFTLALALTVAAAPLAALTVATAPTAEASMVMASWYKARARLRSQTEFKGAAVYRERPRNGTTEQRLVFKVQHGAPNTTYNVLFNNESVGELTTNGLGKGRLRFRTAEFNDNPRVLPMPPGFPTVVEGDTVKIGTLDGTFRVVSS